MCKKIGMFLLMTLILSGVAAAGTRTYPGCGVTLQACINSAQSGDIVYISASVIKENLTINKSLTLMASPGSAMPVFGNDFSTYTIKVEEGPFGAMVDVQLSRLYLINARIEVDFDAGTGHFFMLEDSTLYLNQSGMGALKLIGEAGAAFRLYRNRITSSYWGVDVYTNLPANQTVTYVFSGNTISSPNSSVSNGGIYFIQAGAGNSLAFVVNNIIYDVTGCCADGAGIKLYSTGDSTNHFDILNNTIDDVNDGSGISIPATGGNSIQSAFIGNNIVTRVGGNWLEASQATIPALSSVYEDYNTYYLAGNVGSTFPDGPNSVSEDPLFVNQPDRDYRLQLFSPCINTGNSGIGYVGAPSMDGQGGPRFLGSGEDRGALEAPATLLNDYMAAVDLFDDAVLSDSYQYAKGNWIEDGTNLLVVPSGKSTMTLDNGVPCVECTVLAYVRTSEPLVTGRLGKLWISGWYENSDNFVQLQITEGSDKILLKQRKNGVIVAKAKALVEIMPERTRRFQIRYNGSEFSVSTGGLFSQNILTMPATGVSSGDLRFQAKGAVGYLTDFFVY